MQNSILMFTLSFFDSKIPFLGKLGPKAHNCPFKLKFGTQANSNMQNSMAVFTFSVLDKKHSFLGKFGLKNQSFKFILKLDTQTNSNMQNSMVPFIFSILDRTQIFWGANLLQKVKIASLSLNLVPRLIRICQIQWWCSRSLFYTGNTLFDKRRAIIVHATGQRV